MFLSISPSSNMTEDFTAEAAKLRRNSVVTFDLFIRKSQTARSRKGDALSVTIFEGSCDTR